MVEFEDVIGDTSDFRDVPLEQATRYAAEDAHVTWMLWHQLQSEVRERELESVFETIDMPLVPVLSRMERRGVALDREFLKKYSGELEAQLGVLEKEILQAAGVAFNLNSPKQLSEVLFEKLQISTKGIKKTKTGYSTNQSVLERLADVHPVPQLILKYRGLHKLKSTYVDALPAQVSQKTGRLHTSFNQTVTATGRLSSSQPNLQNIPIQTEAGRRVREAFVAAPGNVLISADYSQIELRILAHLSDDKNLIDAFRSGQDIHSKTAREVFHLVESEVLSPQQRRVGKTINFGIVYGMSGFRLARDLGISVKEASEYIDGYFRRYSSVKEYFGHLEECVEAGTPVTTLFGRKRFVDEMNGTGRDPGFVKRAALNAPIQGSAADIIKLAMIQMELRIRENALPLQMLMQIHDELVFECGLEHGAHMLEVVKETMEQVVSLSVPLVVDVRTGRSWQEAH